MPVTLNKISKTILLVFIAMTAVQAHSGTIIGSIQSSSGGPVVGGTLTFTLSQSAIVSGTALIVPTTVSCYTSTGGAVVGLPDPASLPVLSANYGAGTLAAGTYYVKVTYYNGSGETIASPEAVFTMTSTGTLIVNAPVSQPSNATGYKVYISSASGTETLQATQSSFVNYSQSAPLSNGSALPSSNSSACTIRFSDELIPSGTNYQVNLLNKNGAQMAGYPQTWYTFGGSGGSINVSNGTPQGGGAVIYPTPILANPVGNAQQSISGPLSLGGYAIVVGSIAINGGTTITGQSGTGSTVMMNNSPVLNGTPTGTGIPTFTMKKGSGGGTYTTSSTTYVDVDSTNLSYTVTIPVGWKLLINVQADVSISTGLASVGIGIWDGTIVNQTNTVPGNIGGNGNSTSLTWIINGDGASHTVKLQFATSAGTDAANIINSATTIPTMTFILSPSN